MSPCRTYDQIIDFQSPALETLVGQGRRLLAANDKLMQATLGQDVSLYTSSRLDAIEVAVVNLCYAFATRDWQLVGLALAALEVALSNDEQPTDALRRRIAQLSAMVRAGLETLDDDRRTEALAAMGSAMAAPDARAPGVADAAYVHDNHCLGRHDRGN